MNSTELKESGSHQYSLLKKDKLKLKQRDLSKWTLTIKLRKYNMESWYKCKHKLMITAFSVSYRKIVGVQTKAVPQGLHHDVSSQSTK